MKKTTASKHPLLRFRRWANKKFSAFRTVGKEVSIGTLSGETADTLLPKNGDSPAASLIRKLEKKVLGGGSVDYDEALALAAVADREALYAAADRIRAAYHQERFDLCSIINARSGRCTENCKWCSQSAHHHTSIDTYDLIDAEEAIAQARTNEAAGVRKFSLVTSGRALPAAHLEKLCSIYDTLRETTSLELCASMGLLDADKLARLAASGVKNYHCNLETAPSYFPQLCTTHTTQEKIDTLRAARTAGMKLCSGGIIGMGESEAQRVELAITLQQLGVESIPLNLLNPIPGTPLENTPPLGDDEILTTIAIFRFTNPRAWIRFAGGRTGMLHLQDRALRAGINGALVGDLLTTVGVGMSDDISHIRSLGFDC